MAQRVNFIELESARKLRGGFYTQADMAGFLTRWVAAGRPGRVLEPSCGDGAFLEALRRARVPALKSVFACELDPAEAAKARARARFGKPVTVEVRSGDFLEWYLTQGQAVEPFDGVLGNPPFIRYQYLPESQQVLAERIFEGFGLPFTRHTNSWVPFVMASLALLRPGGRLGMVIPSEIFHIPHAQSLRRYLAEQCARILILDPEEIWFNDTLQGTVLLMAEKKLNPKEPGRGVGVVPVADRQVLQGDPEELLAQAAYANGETLEGKWMRVFLSAAERRRLGELQRHPNIRRFKELAQVDVGIVTGANQFFLVPDRVVEEFGLERWAHPMFGRSDHVQGLVYSPADHAANKRAGLPANFLWFQEEALSALPPRVRQYLEKGRRQKLHARFKCRVRTPWYKVPSVSTAPIGMLKRAHHFPRLILNTAEAFTTDTAYRVRPLGSATAEGLVLGFVNSLTCLTAELEGRHYGGGVLELVPSEIERLLVPVLEVKPAEFQAADERFRQAADECAFLREQDERVLESIGVGRQERELLYAAWVRLRQRRQRSPG